MTDWNQNGVDQTLSQQCDEIARLTVCIAEQQAEIERLNNKINWWITTDEARKRDIAEKQAEIELLRKQVATVQPSGGGDDEQAVFV